MLIAANKHEYEQPLPENYKPVAVSLCLIVQLTPSKWILSAGCRVPIIFSIKTNAAKRSQPSCDHLFN